MATLKVRKLGIGATDISGLKSSRYEKLQVSYGSIDSTAYALGDTLVFSDVPSKDIIRATVVAHATVPVTLEVYPGTSNANPFTLQVATTQAACKLSYIIEYVRGCGRVGSALGDDSGEGELFSVIVAATGGTMAATKEEQVP
jgi:hypothetical protein